MPLTKSAKKAWRSSERKRERNKVQEVELEKALKSVSEKNINEVISKIDKAAKTHLISKNKAARLKSRLAKKYETPKATPKPKVKSSKAKSSKKSKV
jgi:small subunit ribosomal protein S20